ncbi:FAD/FMN-containing dehydrogenase [Palleronia aestuarii]|uniref:FAD/FMN-containing dehydrogenase n=1 Tax=Palleronia aestuarii TaxID=568105 RepID=A0A2W7P8I5_9RHOB|nr:FAD-binding oxidoreductase [Palleronia aestuarii]PZX19702.1 FAD/FMN-containing dehydrogenase [Palleronia aestuarii]
MTLAPLTPALLAALRPELSEGCERDISDAYLSEPRDLWRGVAGAILAPRDVEEVARIVRFAARERVGIVPWSGGTGLVGGQTLTEGPAPIVLSLERMSKVPAVYPRENVLVAEAGAILADVHTAAAESDRLFPLSLASEGSARIGGLLATNAGGVNVLRYGNARDLCFGIEAVLPDGSIMRGLKRLRKDNTGYDLRNLLIGAEGTLGVITAAALRLFPQPVETGTAILTVAGPSAALDLLEMAERRGGVSAFELISGQGLRFLTETGLLSRLPFDEIPEWCVLVEIGAEAGGMVGERLETLFTEGYEAGLVTDGVVAQNAAQRAELWSIRETIPEANRRVGAIVSSDISLPLSAIPDFLESCDAKLATADLRINAFGHLGDGNLHYNLFPPPGRSREEFAGQRAALRHIIDEEVAAYDGSFSAEHGIGRLKVTQLQRYGDPAKLAAMRAIKKALDPVGIMNPGAVLGPEVRRNSPNFETGASLTADAD